MNDKSPITPDDADWIWSDDERLTVYHDDGWFVIEKNGKAIISLHKDEIASLYAAVFGDSSDLA